MCRVLLDLSAAAVAGQTRRQSFRRRLTWKFFYDSKLGNQAFQGAGVDNAEKEEI